MTLDERVEAFGGALSMREAIALGPLQWLTRQLVETDGSRARLRFWQDAGRPGGPFTPNVFAMSGKLYRAAEYVWTRLPPPVAWHASARVLLSGIDGPCAGFTGYAPRLAVPASFDEQLHVVAVDCRLSPGDLFGVIAHEIAHCFVGSVQSADQAYTSAHYQDVKALADRIAKEPSESDMAALLRIARDEELANILPQQWGFTGLGADVRRLTARGSLTYIKEGLSA